MNNTAIILKRILDKLDDERDNYEEELETMVCNDEIDRLLSLIRDNKEEYYFIETLYELEKDCDE